MSKKVETPILPGRDGENSSKDAFYFKK